MDYSYELYHYSPTLHALLFLIVPFIITLKLIDYTIKFIHKKTNKNMTNFKELSNKRILFYYTTSVKVANATETIIEEAEVLEVSPSGKNARIKCSQQNGTFWISISDVIEELPNIKP